MTTPNSVGWQQTGGGILIPLAHHSADALPAPTSESLRVLQRDYGTAPPDTPAAIRDAYEAIVRALLSAERLRHELASPRPVAGQRVIEVGDLITSAKSLYPTVESQLRVDHGVNAWAEAIHTLDNISRMLADPIRLSSCRMFGQWPGPAELAETLNAMRDQVAARNMPPRRRGNTVTIEGYDLRLAPQSAELLEYALKRGGTSFDDLRTRLPALSDATPNEIRARVTKMTIAIDVLTRQTPFYIETKTDGEVLVAMVVPR